MDALKGSVTISLKDYHDLLVQDQNNKDARSRLVLTAKELGVFLSYLASREDIKKHVESFNVQSATSKIEFEGTKAIISLRENI
tara:strand:+ start:1724 stop:1975 length:252 start_codon:yes stop_codon:yes gene_type:complete